MARAALGIGVRELAEAAGVTPATFSRFENGHRRGYADTLLKIQAALEAAGIEFLNGDAPGVRLRKPPTGGIAGP